MENTENNPGLSESERIGRCPNEAHYIDMHARPMRSEMCDTRKTLAASSHSVASKFQRAVLTTVEHEMRRDMERRAHRYREHAKAIRRAAGDVSDAFERSGLLAAAREFEELVDGLEGPSSNAVCFCGQTSGLYPSRFAL